MKSKCISGDPWECSVKKVSGLVEIPTPSTWPAGPCFPLKTDQLLLAVLNRTF